MRKIKDVIRNTTDLLYTLKKERVHKLFIAFLLIISLFGTITFLFESSDPNSTIKSLFDGMWWSIVTFATVGYGDKYPVTWQGKIAGSILIMSALVLTVIISGTIASILVERKMREGKGLQKIEFTNHIIICGFNRTLDRILNDFQKLCNKIKEEINIVLINELETDTLSEFQFTYSSKLLKIEFIRGNFSHDQVLEKANIKEAKSVLILADQSGGDKNIQNADERTVLASYTISNINPGAQISVELINPQNEQHLKRMNIANIIVNGEFNSFFLVNAAVFPGVPQAAKEMMNFDFSNDITTRTIPQHFVGKTFSELMNHFKDKDKSILIGIIAEAKKLSIDDFISEDPSSIDEFIRRKFAESEKDHFADTGGRTRVAINPGWDYKIQDNEKAIVIGEVGAKK
jgi:voltage-gated potassium channel